MTDADLIDIRACLGIVRIVETRGVGEDGALLLGGYSITYDRDGNEISRTENRWNCRITYS